jgi:hypothetical protein
VTVKTEREALGEGRTVCNILGPAWELNVWQNFGWHWSLKAQQGRVRLHPGSRSNLTGAIETWTVFVNNNGNSGGVFTGKGATPREALEDALRVSEERYNDEQAMLRSIRSVVGTAP